MSILHATFDKPEYMCNSTNLLHESLRFSEGHRLWSDFRKLMRDYNPQSNQSKLVFGSLNAAYNGKWSIKPELIKDFLAYIHQHLNIHIQVWKNEIDEILNWSDITKLAEWWEEKPNYMRSFAKLILQYSYIIENNIQSHTSDVELPNYDTKIDSENSLDTIESKLKIITPYQLLYIYESAILSYRSGGAEYLKKNQSIPITQQGDPKYQTNWLFAFLSSKSRGNSLEHIQKKENLHDFLHNWSPLSDFWTRKIAKNMKAYLSGQKNISPKTTKMRIEEFLNGE